MKKTKSLLLLLAGLLLFPAVAKADYKVYSVGEYVNFIVNASGEEKLKAGDTDNAGLGTLVIEPKDKATNEYVRAAAMLITNGSEYSPLEVDGVDGIVTDIKKTNVWQTAKGTLMLNTQIDSKYIKDINGNDTENFNFISLADLVALGADKDNDYYLELSETKNIGAYALFYNMLLKSTDGNKGYNYYYLNDIDNTDETDSKWWILEIIENEAGSDVTGIKAKAVSVNDLMTNEEYTSKVGVISVLSFKKDFDCHANVKKACYRCKTDKENVFKFVWTQEGTQAEGCELTTYNDESKCYKNPETGVMDYAFEIIGVIAVCACGLVVLKKNDFFRA